MLLRLVEIYTAMTPEGNIKGINVMEEKMRLERSFSEGYSHTQPSKKKRKKRRSLKEKV